MVENHGDAANVVVLRCKGTNCWGFEGCLILSETVYRHECNYRLVILSSGMNLLIGDLFDLFDCQSDSGSIACVRL